MLFSSPEFFVFFAIYLAFHCVIPRHYRIFLIIAGSTIFYAWWKPSYIGLPYLLLAVAYYGARWTHAAGGPSARRVRVVATVVLLFIPLLFFKYANFVYRDVLRPFLGGPDRLVDLPLPLGVSFITFTLTAYVVDVYRRRFPSDRPLSSVLGYILFFPHLIAGPILRPNDLIPQIERPRPAWSVHWTAAIAIFTMGLVKKLVFADQIGAMVDAIYSRGAAPSGPQALFALYGFSLQIYCDFSGYTDMAIGLAMLLGVRLPNNFLQPYAAFSIVDFWRRWHITLSLWLRDYLYIPLGGNRRGPWRTARSVLITMVLGGLWHGASWTFVMWGLLHGVAIAALQATKRMFGKDGTSWVPNWLGLLLTFHFVTLAWVFFRAPDFPRALQMLAAPFVGGWTDLSAVADRYAFQAVLLAVFFALHTFDDHRRVRILASRMPRAAIWPIIAVCWMLVTIVSQGQSAKFVYFDF